MTPAGDIIEVDDGGVYRRTVPRGTGTWLSLNNNLQITEFHSVDYDAVGNVVIGGTQDVGTVYQSAAGSSTWRTANQGDGGVVAVDDVSLAGANQSIRYTSSQNFGGFTRRTFAANNSQVSSVTPGLLVGGEPLSTVDANIGFYQLFALNEVDPTRGVIATRHLYESTDRFDTLVDISGDVAHTIDAVSYGGYSGGVANVHALWFAANNQLYLRSAAGGPVAPVSYPGGDIRDLVVDADEWRTAYVIDDDQVWTTNNAGASWTDVTGNLDGLVAGSLRTIEFMEGAGGVDAILVGAAGGVFETESTDLGTWSVFGANLPNGVVRDLVYDATDDVLLAGTMGRGAWTINQASAQIPLSFSILATNPADEQVVAIPPTSFTLDFSGTYDAASVSPSDLTINGLPAQTIEFVDADTVTFHFAVSPVLSQGPQTVATAAGAFRIDGGTQTSPALAATFYYDVAPLTILSTTPAGGSLVTLPVAIVEIRFSEDVLESSIQAVDLVLSQGIVDDVELLDGDTVRYLVSGVATEGTWTVGLPAGALADAFGNPSASFSASFVLDFGEIPLPTPFIRSEPLGSLTFATSPQAGDLFSGADTDEFLVHLEAGTTLSALVAPQRSTLSLQVGIVGLSSTVFAPAPGRNATLPPVVIPVTGTYGVRVGGNTSGGYRLSLFQNAASELQVGGSSNGNELPIGTSAVDLGSGERFAALGESRQSVLVPKGALWRYRDDGADLGVAWRASAFDDASWSLGPAQFGYGDGDEETLLREVTSTGTRIRTFYFRHSFVVTDRAGIGSLLLRLLRDDGAAVYLNGAEVRRDNLAAGANAAAFATARVDQIDEPSYHETSISGSLLVDGTNVLAVEVHQQADTSSDVGFDMEVVAVGAAQTIVPAGAVWKYLDNGTNQGVLADGVAWFGHPDYNDSSWAEGPAELGYGDGDEATVVDCGPVAACTSSNYVTTYFRKRFAVVNPSQYATISLELVRDDGAAVFLNGVEVVRSNLPAGATYTTLTTEIVNVPNEVTFNSFPVDPSLLRDGDNVLAVEIHQSATTSSDISFNLRLRGTLRVPDVDEYTLDLTDNVNGRLDVLLAGHDADFSGALVELLSPTNAVVATASTSPLGVAATNYDLGILGWPIAAPGVYTVRVSASQPGRYGLFVSADLTIESEPNDATTDALRSISDGKSAIGFLTSQSSDVDWYRVNLEAGQLSTFSTATPHPAGDDPSLDPMLQLWTTNGDLLGGDDDSAEDSRNARLQLVVPENGEYLVRVAANSGGGEYVLNTSTGPALATLAGRVFLDANRDAIDDPREVGIPGRVVFLDENGNDLLDAGETAATASIDVPETGSDEAGRFQFVVPPGTYRVVQAAVCGEFRSTVAVTIVVSAGQIEPVSFGSRSLPPGDLNGDDLVGLSDLTILQSRLSAADGGVRPEGDVNCDGAIDRRDAARLSLLFGRDHSPAPPSQGSPSQGSPSPAALVRRTASVRAQPLVASAVDRAILEAIRQRQTEPRLTARREIRALRHSPEHFGPQTGLRSEN